MLLIKAVLTDTYCVSVCFCLADAECLAQVKTTKVNCKIWKQVKSSCSALRRIKLLFTLFVSDSKRIVFVNKAINWHELSIEPPKNIENKVPLAGFLRFYPTCVMGGWSGGKAVNEGQSLIANELYPGDVNCGGGRWRLHLVGGKMMLWDSIGMSHHCVILIEAPHAVHFIVDAAGDVLNVLHMGPERSTNIQTHKDPVEKTDKP